MGMAASISLDWRSCVGNARSMPGEADTEKQPVLGQDERQFRPSCTRSLFGRFQCGAVSRMAALWH
jgi:hypothetical protein